MFGPLINVLLFLAIPAVILALFGVCLYRYISAERLNRKAPYTFTPEEMNRRKIFLILSSAAVGVLLFVVVGITALLFMAIAFM